ncbi:MAG: hypothetical protein II815_09540 [Bacteroidales bacterium]|nr:hypothetical protein [Bacteroidales bacterium]
MKKIFVAMMLVIASSILFGQVTIKETFETNKYQWDEYFEKNCSSSIENGYLLLSNRDKDTFITAVGDLPINNDRNFKAKFDITSKVSDDFWFGIVYNYEDESNYSCFLVKEKRYKIINRTNGVSSTSRQGGIILKAGKERNIEFLIEKKGTRLIFNVDNMEVVSISKVLYYTTFGFYVDGNNSIKVTGVQIDQK